MSPARAPTISDLLRDAAPGADALDPSILGARAAGVTSDSREVRPGSVFVAIRGLSHDGHLYLPDVARAGAALAVIEAGAAVPPGLSALVVPDTRRALARIAANLHGRPTHSMAVIGVTGTSGKTTTTYLLESILAAAGRKPGLVGTIGVRFAGKFHEATHTTPGPLELQALFAGMRDAGCDAVVMEVSSHALKQLRVEAIEFDGAVFTNLTREHLDYHPDMEDYFRSKAILFTECLAFSRAMGKRPFAAINAEDPRGEELAALARAGGAPTTLFDTRGLASLAGGIRGRAGAVDVDSRLVGGFNASNIAAAAAAATALGIPSASVAQGIQRLAGVPGRMERVSIGVPDEPLVIVDYAHKPDALQKVLVAARRVAGGRLITVVGCGGDRDRTKRPEMGRIAAEGSDRVVLTSDNPRTEDPGEILDEVVAGVPAGRMSHVAVEPDRREAIFRAVDLAEAGDVVLIAGKGHETYQILPEPVSHHGRRGTVRIAFDDREVAREALRRRFG